MVRMVAVLADRPSGGRPLRVRTARVLPIEIWDLRVGQRRLFEWMDDPRLGEMLAQVVADLRAGTAESWLGRLPPAPIRQVDTVWLAGGGASPQIAAALAARGFAVERPAELEYTGEAGARGLGLSDALVVDVGQTALKLSYAGERRRVARDFAALPEAWHWQAGDLAAGRQRFIAFVAAAIAGLVGDRQPAQAVLALPCELDADAVARGCSYPYRAPDRQLAADLCGAAGLPAERTLVLNDAELAAHGILADATLAGDRTRLAVTLGYGPGAALVLP